MATDRVEHIWVTSLADKSVMFKAAQRIGVINNTFGHLEASAQLPVLISFCFALYLADSGVNNTLVFSAKVYTDLSLLFRNSYITCTVRLHKKHFSSASQQFLFYCLPSKAEGVLFKPHTDYGNISFHRACPRIYDHRVGIV